MMLFAIGTPRCGLCLRLVPAFGVGLLNTRLDALDMTLLVGPLHLGIWLNRDEVAS